MQPSNSHPRVFRHIAHLNHSEDKARLADGTKLRADRMLEAGHDTGAAAHAVGVEVPLRNSAAERIRVGTWI